MPLEPGNMHKTWKTLLCQSNAPSQTALLSSSSFPIHPHQHHLASTKDVSGLSQLWQSGTWTYSIQIVLHERSAFQDPNAYKTTNEFIIE
jgi:hypothetical protein